MLLDIFEGKKLAAVPENFEEVLPKLIDDLVVKYSFKIVYSEKLWHNGVNAYTFVTLFNRANYVKVGEVLYCPERNIGKVFVDFSLSQELPQHRIVETFELDTRYKTSLFLKRVEELLGHMDKVFDKQKEILTSLERYFIKNKKVGTERITSTSMFTIDLKTDKPIERIIIKYPRYSVNSINDLFHDDLFYFRTTSLLHPVEDENKNFSLEEIIDRYSKW